MSYIIAKWIYRLFEIPPTLCAKTHNTPEWCARFRFVRARYHGPLTYFAGPGSFGKRRWASTRGQRSISNWISSLTFWRAGGKWRRRRTNGVWDRRWEESSRDSRTRPETSSLRAEWKTRPLPPRIRQFLGKEIILIRPFRFVILRRVPTRGGSTHGSHGST